MKKVYTVVDDAALEKLILKLLTEYKNENIILITAIDDPTDKSFLSKRTTKQHKNNREIY